jgi:hypothetical protein
MLRKSLILGSITLLMVMLFALTGCEGPVGPAGDPGVNGLPGSRGEDGYDGTLGGRFLGGPDITEEDLIDAFARNDIIGLESGVDSVYGLVPAGKTLVVVGTRTKILYEKTLAIDGTLQVSDGAILSAAAIRTTPTTNIYNDVGALTASESAKIIGGGAIILPYVLGGDFKGGLHFNSEQLLTSSSPSRYPGAVFQNDRTFTAPDPTYIGEYPVQLPASSLPYIFAKEQVNKLTVYNIIGLRAGTSPADIHIPGTRELTLKGTGNTLDSAAFDLKGGASLIVDKDAKLTATGTAITVYEASTIINKGIIDLGSGGSADIDGNGSHFYNDGTIISRSTNLTVVEKLIGLWGTQERGGIGTVDFTVTTVNPFSVGYVPLRQNFLIKGGRVNLSNTSVDDPFNGVVASTITIDRDAVLALGTYNVRTGAKIVNDGVFITDTRSAEILKYFWSEMDNKGKVTATGDLANETSNAGTGIREDFVIPEGIELTLTNKAKLESNPDLTKYPDTPFDVIVNGTLKLGDVDNPGPGFAALVPNKNVIVNGALELAAGSLSPAGNVDINGSLNTGTGTGLTIALGKFLTIADSSKIKGGVGPIVITSAGNLAINGTKGYQTANAGIQGGAFIESLADIHTAAANLKPDITLAAGSPFNPSSTADPLQVIGTVEIEAGSGNTYPVSQTVNAVADIDKFIAVPVGVDIFTGGVLPAQSIQIITGGGATAPFYVTANAFSIDIDSSSKVSFADSGWTSPGGYVFGVISFNAVRFMKGNLVGPVVSPFMVGIKSLR